MKRFLSLLGCCLGLLAAGCSDTNVEPPAALVSINTTVNVQQVWSHSIGASDPILHLGLIAASDGTNVYAASHDGDIYAFRLKDGERLWKVAAGSSSELSGGPSVGNGMVAAAARDGTVVVLDAKTGKEVWQTSVNDEVLTAPAISESAIVVHATDGHIIALSATSGQIMWNISREPPRLSLRGSSAPVIVGSTVYVGLNNGKLVALRLSDGNQLWERAVGAPTGSDELSRLIDLDGVLDYDEGKLFAVTFQGKVAEVASDSGQPLWLRDMSSYTGVSTDDEHAYVSDVHGEVWALNKDTGVPVWTQPALRARDVTLPVPYMGTVVVGDLQGYLHFMSAVDGTFVARVRLDSDPIQAPPIVAGGLLVALSTDGELAAYRISKPAAQK